MSREKSGNLINKYVTITLFIKNFTYICMLDMMVNTLATIKRKTP
jgi:hypothetical protein